MQIDKVSLCIISSDTLFMKQLHEQVQSRFKNLRFDLDICDSGNQALQKIKSNDQKIIIAVENSLGMTVEDFESELMRRSSLTTSMVLGRDKKGTSSMFFVWPLVEWGSFLDVLQDCIPEELKHKYGLKNKNSLLYDLLNKYGSQFFQNQSQDLLAVPSLIPVLAVGEVSENKGMASSSQGENLLSETRVHEYIVPRNWIYFEIGFVVALLAMTVASYFYFDEIYVFVISVVVTTFCSLSLVLSRYINPLLKKG